MQTVNLLVRVWMGGTARARGSGDLGWAHIHLCVGLVLFDGTTAICFMTSPNHVTIEPPAESWRVRCFEPCSKVSEPLIWVLMVHAAPIAAEPVGQHTPWSTL